LIEIKVNPFHRCGTGKGTLRRQTLFHPPARVACDSFGIGEFSEQVNIR
jgi:hypothetical protein